MCVCVCVRAATDAFNISWQPFFFFRRSHRWSLRERNWLTQLLAPASFVAFSTFNIYIYIYVSVAVDSWFIWKMHFEIKWMDNASARYMYCIYIIFSTQSFSEYLFFTSLHFDRFIFVVESFSTFCANFQTIA